MPRAFSPQEFERIRMRLIEVGRELLSVTGFRKTTVRDIVRRVGVSKGGFYLFFESKEALWIEIIQGAERDLRAQLTALAERPDLEGNACLRALLRAIFGAVTTHPMLRALADPDDLAWLMRTVPEEALVEARRDDDAFFSALYATLEARGVVRSDATLAANFATLPAAALALIQGRSIIGEDRLDAFLEFEIEAWIGRLAANMLRGTS